MTIEAALVAWARVNCTGEYLMDVNAPDESEASFWSRVAVRDLFEFFHEFEEPSHRFNFAGCPTCAPWSDALEVTP